MIYVIQLLSSWLDCKAHEGNDICFVPRYISGTFTTVLGIELELGKYLM